MKISRYLIFIFASILIITMNFSVFADEDIDGTEEHKAPLVSFELIEATSTLEDYQGESFPLENAFDEDPDTFWHTEIGGGGYHPVDINEGITIVFDGSYQLTELKYLPRQDTSWGRITEYEILIKGKNDDEFKSVYVGFVEMDDGEAQVVNLSKIIDVEVVAIQFIGTLGSNGSMSVAELEIRGNKVE